MTTLLGIALMLPSVYVITLGVTLTGIHVAVRVSRSTIGVRPEQQGWQRWMDETQEWNVDAQTQDGQG